MSAVDECACDREQTPVLDSLNKTVADAAHLGPLDQPTIDAARVLARKIDMADLYFQALAQDADDHEGRPPSQDNVSIPTFLRYCDALGLTPMARQKFKEAAQKGGTGGKLSGLRDVTGNRSAA